MSFKNDTDGFKAAALKAAADYGSAGLAAYNDAVASAEGQLAGAGQYEADARARGVPQEAAAQLGGIMRNSAEFGIAQARRGRASVQNTAAGQTASINQYFDMLQGAEPFVTAYTQATMGAQGASSEEQEKLILGEARSMRAQAERDYSASRGERDRLTGSSVSSLSGAIDGMGNAAAELSAADKQAKAERQKAVSFSNYRGDEQRLAAAMGVYGKKAQQQELDRQLRELQEKNLPRNPTTKQGTRYGIMRESLIDEFRRLPQVKEGDTAEFDRLTKGNLAAAEQRLAAAKQGMTAAAEGMSTASERTQRNSRTAQARFGRTDAVRGSTEEQLAREIAKSRYGYTDAQAYAAFGDKSASEQATELRGQDYLNDVSSGRVDMENQVDSAKMTNEFIGMQMPEVAMMAEASGLPEQVMAQLLQDQRFRESLDASMDDANQLLVAGNGGQSIQDEINRRLAQQTQLPQDDPDYLSKSEFEVIAAIVRSRTAGRNPENAVGVKRS